MITAFLLSIWMQRYKKILRFANFVMENIKFFEKNEKKTATRCAAVNYERAIKLPR